ncbi:MAG: hypothetical protein KDA42_00050 [Planctomycetales bacterium]|nr:hypothetical protein [Planctomycetales bacterium]
MRTTIRVPGFRIRQGLVWLFAAVCVLPFASCKSSSTKAERGEVDTKSAYWPKPQGQFQEVQLAALHVPVPQIENAEYVNDDTLCMVCHETYVKTFQHNIHRGQSCEQCHGPGSRHLQTRGKEPGSILSFKTLPPAQKSELCLKCHQEDQCAPGGRWRNSVHAHNGVACTDCHTGHYNVPPGTPATTDLESAEIRRLPPHQLVSLQMETPAPDMATLRANSHHMGAISPQICYRCHGDMEQYEHVAHPHQMLGQNSFTCATCHDPHGKIRHESRTQLCLECHKDAPTMAWHSSSHSLHGVACTDCHNPHPKTGVADVVNISHTNVRRAPRMPMSVDEPNVCFGCHPKIYAETSMPSHHPIKEGKLVCSDCHDGHGQAHGNLKEATTNQLCYKCHAEKQGPFVYSHPPVTEDCGICHNPHGTVANNLLHQPATFLCLRCHTGHRVGPTFGPHTGAGVGDVGTTPSMQAAFYSDCTQCHAQIHGSDLPSPHLPRSFAR